MSTAGWNPSAVGTAVIGIVTFVFMAKTAIVIGYRYVSAYVYKIRFFRDLGVKVRVSIFFFFFGLGFGLGLGLGKAGKKALQAMNGP